MPRFTVLLALLSTLLFASPAFSAPSCKGLSKSQCDRSDNCSWVNGYTTKKGTQVKPYCRSKAGKSSSTGKKSSKTRTHRTETKQDDQRRKQTTSKGKKQGEKEKAAKRKKEHEKEKAAKKKKKKKSGTKKGSKGEKEKK